MRVLAFLGGILFAFGAAAATYSIADLEALAKQEAWQELIDHAEDIAPSQRNEHWQMLVEKAGIGVLTGLDVDKVSFTGLGAADVLLRRFPQLKRSKPFMQKRADVGLRAFTRCFELTGDDNKDSDACAARLVGFSDGDPDNADLSRRAIALIAQHAHFSAAAAAPIYYRLIGRKKGAKECSDAGAKRAVIDALDLQRADPRVAQALEVASQYCWPEMQNELVDAIGRPHEVGHYFENSCGFLVEKKALGTLSTNRCKALPK